MNFFRLPRNCLAFSNLSASSIIEKNTQPVFFRVTNAVFRLVNTVPWRVITVLRPEITVLQLVITILIPFENHSGIIFKEWKIHRKYLWSRITPRLFLDNREIFREYFQFIKKYSESISRQSKNNPRAFTDDWKIIREYLPTI